MYKFLTIMLTVILLALVTVLQFPNVRPVSGAPPIAQLTPVAYNATNGGARMVTYLNDDAVVADDLRCVDSPSFDTVDLQYAIDETGVNTTTLTQWYSNDKLSYTTGPVIVSTVVADADDIKQYALFGRWSCIDVNVANATPVSIKIMGLLK